MTEQDLLTLRGEFPALAESVYLISHSLGAMPQATTEALAEFASLWVKKSIVAWEDWLRESQLAAGRIARILGAAPGTVQMATNVSQVQATIASSLDFASPRNRVVYTDMNFPSVSYVWKAEERRGAEVVLVKSDDGITVPTERMLAAIDERTLIVLISHVLFRSSYVQDAAAIVKRAHEVGALVLLDVYQSAGIVPLDVTTLDVDFATGGSVKWLCGGPGAAYLYVRPDLIPRFSPRTTGWFAHRAPFAFTMPEQDYADGIARFGGGTLAIAPLYQATVCFDFPGSDKVCAELNRRKFFCDHRPGAGIRCSPHFYNTDDEISRFLDEVERIRAGK